MSIKIPQYSSQSLPFKVDIISKIKDSMSVSEKVNFLYPNWTEDERLMETCKIKKENGIPMTREENDFALREGIINIPMT